MTVLLIGYSDLQEQVLLSDAIETRDHEVLNCDVRNWPGGPPLALTPGSNEVLLGGTRFDYDDISGAYIHPSLLFQPYEPRFTDPITDDLIPVLNQLREHRSIFQSLSRILEDHGADVVPPFRNHGFQDQKPWQLHLYDLNDLHIPDTVFTNDPDELRSFYDTHERVIYKPVTRGGGPHELTDSDLTQERLEKLATAPIQLQEYAPGDDIRIYVLNGEVIGAMRYETDQFSFKIDLQNGDEDSIDIQAATISEDITETVTRAAKQTGLIFTAADVRRQHDGTYSLLELNETPRFAAAHAYTDQDIAGQLAEFLIE
jgi:glutathione synthase/RimK-type ligase-like ATP-grasp enzyme